MVPRKPVSFFPRRMHPNLTKGFGMIGPKDFFPLLDFAYMPNNSLTPRKCLRQAQPAVKNPI